MDLSKITVRYAKAFFLLAKENKSLDQLKADVELILSVMNESADFLWLMESPVAKMSQKVKAIELIFKDKIDKSTINFIKLIIENKREIYIAGICRNFLDLCRKEEGIKTAVFTSPTALDDKILKQVKDLLEKEFNAKIEMSEKVNENLLGGFIVRVDDQQYDASIATQLKKIKENLINTELK